MNNSNPISPKPDRPQTVVRLVRVSHDASDNGRQYDETDQVAKKLGLAIVETMEFQGVSGTAIWDTPKGRELSARIASGDIDGVLASALDRALRPKNFEQTGKLQQFADLKKLIITAREGIIEPWTDAGWEQCMTLATRAGVQLREIRRLSISGKITNAADGYCNSGSAPYGYRQEHVLKTNKLGRPRQRTVFVIYEPEASTVRLMYTLALAGHGVYEIAKQLNLQGIPSPHAGKIAPRTGKPCSGKWYQQVVWQTLTNEIYCGIYEYPKGSPDATRTCNPEIAIVEEPVWQAVRLALQGRRDARSGRPSRHYLLTGLIWCKYCGHRVGSRTSSRGRGAYQCTHVDQRPPAKRLCDAPRFDQKNLETRVWDHLFAVVRDPDTLYAMIEAAYGNRPVESPSARVAELKTQIESLRQAEEAAYVNLKDPKLHEIRSRTVTDWEDTRKARRNAEFEFSQLQAAQPAAMPNKEAIAAMARELAAYEPEGFEERRTFLKLLVNEIRIDSTNATIETIIPEEILNRTQGLGSANTPEPTRNGGGEQGGAKKKGAQMSHCRVYSNETFTPAVSSPHLSRPISFNINVKLA